MTERFEELFVYLNEIIRDRVDWQEEPVCAALKKVWLKCEWHSQEGDAESLRTFLYREIFWGKLLPLAPDQMSGLENVCNQLIEWSVD